MIDEAWLEDWLNRLGHAMASGNLVARIRLLREVRTLPGGAMIATTAEFLLSKLDGETAGKKLAAELAEKIAAASNLTIQAEELHAHAGSTVGIDKSSTKKVVTGAPDE